MGVARAELPPNAESGYPGFDITSWNRLFAPAGTPEPVIARLAGALRHATARTGDAAVTDTPAESADRLVRERGMVRRIIRDSGIAAH